MTDTIQTTHIRTASESIEETILIDDGQTSILQCRTRRELSEVYARTEVRVDNALPRNRILTMPR